MVSISIITCDHWEEPSVTELLFHRVHLRTPLGANDQIAILPSFYWNIQKMIPQEDLLQYIES
jgi:hypothetical protein